MSSYQPGLDRIQLPREVLVRQHFPAPTIADVAAAVRSTMAGLTNEIRPGMRIGVAVGSRGIHDLATIVKAVVDDLRARDCEVVIIPAMGSHGGATPAGQRQVLADYGVSESAMDVPIHDNMETRVVGHLAWDEATHSYQVAESGSIPVAFAETAWACDRIIPIARVKPHTGFRGPYESGMCKMLCVGLGKHNGCARYHREGYGRFPALIPAAAQVVLNTGKITGVLAIVENASERTALVELVPAHQIMQREPEVLNEAKRLMPRLLIPNIDVLVIERVGKNISGTGMDTAIIGRNELGHHDHSYGLNIGRVVVLSLTPETHGNATGIGMADLITEEIFSQIDRTYTYTNILTSGSLEAGRIPVALPTAELAIKAAMTCVPGVAPEDVRLVRIRDTLHLEEIWVSENLLPEVRTTSGMRVANE